MWPSGCRGRNPAMDSTHQIDPPHHFGLCLWIDVCEGGEFFSKISRTERQYCHDFMHKDVPKILDRFGFYPKKYRYQGDGFYYKEDDPSKFPGIIMLRDVVQAEYDIFVRKNISNNNVSAPHLRAVLCGGMGHRKGGATAPHSEEDEEGQFKELWGSINNRPAELIDTFKGAATIVDPICRWILSDWYEFDNYRSQKFDKEVSYMPDMYRFLGLNSDLSRETYSSISGQIFGEIIFYYAQKIASINQDEEDLKGKIRDFRKVVYDLFEKPAAPPDITEIESQLGDIIVSIDDKRMQKFIEYVDQEIAELVNHYGIKMVMSIFKSYENISLIFSKLRIQPVDMSLDDLWRMSEISAGFKDGEYWLSLAQDRSVNPSGHYLE